ncbi:MAG: MarR family transcriptional regulator [Planctomycetota bacterium]|nr:MAG: MarR family transcriptional regulator [Planctomycetota bacterium]REK25758.1 MAG: MarR family transcriptional regulator [Planctomycetota bacterium]REK46494.1 MAG: MarR family transcriptional regulator [Planctomycetota bacterium]
MLQYDYEQSIGYWIMGASQEIQRALNEELAAQGITYRQWEVLALTSVKGEQSQSELAEQMRLEAPTLVGVLDRMERDGWIVRVTDPKDRRRKIIRPTEQVAPAWSRMIECARRIRARATEGIDPEDLETVRRCLLKVRDNLAGSRRPVITPNNSSPEVAAKAADDAS